MTSPNPPHTITLEMFVNGAWTDITTDDYQRQPFNITRGFSSESARKVDPSQLTGLLDNRAKNYSPRNPTGIYYPTLKQNTPVRVAVTSAGTNYRFWGEIAGLVPSADQTGRDLTASLSAGGLLRRLGVGSAAVQSRPRSYLPTTSPIAYWPLEDGALSTQGLPAVGTLAMAPVGVTTQQWGTTQISPWLAPTLTTYYRVSGDGLLYAPITATAAAFTIDFMVTGNSPFEVAVVYDPGLLASTANAYTLSYTPSINSLLLSGPNIKPAGSQSYTLALATNVGHHFRMQVQDNGSNTDCFIYLDGALLVSTTFVNNAPSSTPVGVRLNGTSGVSTANTQGVTFGHVAIWTGVGAAPGIDAAYAASQGALGEVVTDRITRICSEQSITLTIIGTDNRPCGPQYVMTPVDVLQETADVGGGLLYETLTAVGLTYITRDSLYNKAASIALTYTTNHHLGAPLAPVDDDQRRFNSATITRKLGGTQTVSKTTGPLQVAAPPTGIGTYAYSGTINCLTETQAKDRAGWIALNEGTWDDYRYPTITLDMNTLPLTQRAQVLASNVGARLTFASPPSWLPPDTIDLLILGLKDTRLSRFEWLIELVCVPYGPYRVGVWDSATLGKYSSDGSVLNGGHTSTTTSLFVNTASGPFWTTAAADFPFDIRVAGERMTVTNIAGAGNPQTFTVTRSVNSVVKAQTTGTTVELWQPMIWAE